MKSVAGRDVVTITWICAVSVLLVAGFVGARSAVLASHWPIEWIQVSGPFERVSAEQIRAAAAPAVGGGFLAVDLDRVRFSVEALPWVRRAGVRRQWPDRVVVRVLEHEPLAQWNDGQLVSALGEVFSVAGAERIEGLPRLRGPNDSSVKVVGFFDELQSRLSGTGLDVSSMTLTDRGAWHATLTGGVSLLVGSRDPQARLDRLMKVLDQLVTDPGRQLDSIDLRYTNGLAVRWRDSEPVLADASGGEG